MFVKSLFLEKGIYKATWNHINTNYNWSNTKATTSTISAARYIQCQACFWINYHQKNYQRVPPLSEIDMIRTGTEQETAETETSETVTETKTEEWIDNNRIIFDRESRLLDNHNTNSKSQAYTHVSLRSRRKMNGHRNIILLRAGSALISRKEDVGLAQNARIFINLRPPSMLLPDRGRLLRI